jgi:hypothetical protein
VFGSVLAFPPCDLPARLPSAVGQATLHFVFVSVTFTTLLTVSGMLLLFLLGDGCSAGPSPSSSRLASQASRLFPPISRDLPSETIGRCPRGATHAAHGGSMRARRVLAFVCIASVRARHLLRAEQLQDALALDAGTSIARRAARRRARGRLALILAQNGIANVLA